MTQVFAAIGIGFMLLMSLTKPAAAEEVKQGRGIVFAQSAGEPSRTETRPPGSAPLPAPADREGVKPPAAPLPAKPKSAPAFEPTEKVKADQAIDFPADI